MRPLDGKVAIVTGAATGIDKAIATSLGAAGAHVAVNHHNTSDLAEAVVASIQDDGGKAIAIAADGSRREQFEAMVASTIARFGRWDVLVNNAGSRSSNSSAKSPSRISTAASR